MYDRLGFASCSGREQDPNRVVEPDSLIYRWIVRSCISKVVPLHDTLQPGWSGDKLHP